MNQREPTTPEDASVEDRKAGLQTAAEICERKAAALAGEKIA